MWLNHTHIVLHVDHFSFADLGMLFILPAVKKDHKECVILLIATFTLLLQVFLFLEVVDFLRQIKDPLCLLLERYNPTNQQWFVRARPCVRVHLLFCHYKAARPHYIDHRERDGNILSARNWVRNENC